VVLERVNEFLKKDLDKKTLLATKNA